ncbi:MAG TPA: PQQ-binding-like beta-propeller repeat protein [Casimicrobiaceae bacterium]|nr:PQQ-binding-like beta-propeller repeat protein [Casimicrobiaceae bacterium]
MIAHQTRWYLAAFATWFGLCVVPPASADDWLQFDGNAQHSGNNSMETLLDRSNVAALTLKYQMTLPAIADGAPVLLQAVSTPSGVKDLLFVTTIAGHILAIDSQTGSTAWIRQFGPGSCKVNGGSNACFTTSSPAVDPNRFYVYTYGLDGYVHKLKVGDGTEVVTGGWPELATTKGFDEKAASALAIATSNGETYLYVAHGGYPGDNGDYQGHLTAINLGTGVQNVFNALCSDQAFHFLHANASPDCPAVRSAIWARPGVIYDAGTNRIYMATGNGDFDDARNHWGDSVLALNPDGTGSGGRPLDAYTPASQASLEAGDVDLGSTAPAPLPVPANSAVAHLAFQAGKDGKLRLLNLANLSGQNGPGHTGGEVGTVIDVPQGGVVLTQPAVWTNPIDGSTWIFVVNGIGASGLRLELDAGGHPSLVVRWQNRVGGSSPLLANNVLYFASSGTLRAVDPVNGTTLWSSSPIGSIHWQSPVVVNGTVYVADGSSHLSAFAVPGVAPPPLGASTEL